MHFLILCILSSTAIFVIFKSIDNFNIPSFPVIVINYLVAALLGFLINPTAVTFTSIREMDWLPISILIGVLFIIMFFIIAYSSRKAGISVTSVASKMSVIFPIIISLIISTSDKLTFIKSFGIIAALTGVFLTVMKPWRRNFDYKMIYLPLLLFIGIGLVDSLVKYAQHNFVSNENTAVFSAVLFLTAFLSGIFFLIFQPKYLKWFVKIRIWAWGLLLGAVNFGSIFFLVRALNYRGITGNRIDSSIIFGISNIGIVSLSVLLGLLVFKEQLRPINWAGIALSATAIILFTLS